MSLAETQLMADPRRFGLWQSVWKLLKLRLRISWNVFKRSKTRSKIGRIILLVLIVGGMGFLYWVSSLLLRFLQSPELAEYMDPSQFLRVIPTLVLTSAFVVIVLTNFGVLLQSLYLSHDMDFLVTAPIPMRAVFIAKLLEGILPNFALFSAFSLPVLFGLGAASGYNLLFYPLLLLVLAVLAMAAGGLASIMVMGVVRVVPARRVAEVLGFLGATVSILCGQSGNLMNATGVEFDRADVAGAMGLLSTINTPWSPLAWAGRGLEMVGRGDWLPGLGLTLLTLALAGGLFAGTLLLAENLYYTGWSSMQGSARKKKPRAKDAPGRARGSSKPADAARINAAQVLGSGTAGTGAADSGGADTAARRTGLWSWIPRPVRGVMLKDSRLLRRDPRNLSTLITPLIVGVVMMFTTRPDDSRGFNADMTEIGLRDVEAYGLLALSMFVGWMIMFNLGSMAFSREGKNYWLLRSAPVRAWHLLAAKYLVTYIPTIIFGIAYLLFGYLVRDLAWSTLPYNLLALTMIMAGATGIVLAFGAVAARMDWDSPQRQGMRGASGCFGFLAVAGFQLLALVLFLLPPMLYTYFVGPAPWYIFLLGAILGTGAAVLAVLIPLRIAAPRLATLGES